MGECDLKLGEAPLIDVKPDRDDGEAPLLDLPLQFVEFTFAEEELAQAPGIVIKGSTQLVFRDEEVFYVQLTLPNHAERVIEVDGPLAHGLDLRACKHNTGLELLDELEFKRSPAVFDLDDGFVFLFHRV